jgi:rhomboid protease GluP
VNNSSDQPPGSPISNYRDPYDRDPGGARPPFYGASARQPVGERPIVVYTLLGVTVLAFLAQAGTQFLLGYDLLAAVGVKANELIVGGQFWRLITPMFLHGSILHIGFNMYALYVLGPGLERYYGHGRFLALYMLAGFAGNVFSFMFTVEPSLGSSTAIFGLLGAQGVFLYRNRVLFGNVAQRALMNIVLIAAINLVIGLQPGIDNWGHIGGLIGGTLFAWYAGPLFQVEGLYPPYRLVDERNTGDALRAGLAVASLFFFLGAVVIVLRIM